MPSSRIVGPLVLLLVVSAASAAEPAALRWKFDPKVPFYVRVKTHKKEDRTRDEQRIVTENEIEVLFRIKTLEAKSDGTTIVEMYFQTVRQKAVGGMENTQIRRLEGRAVKVTLATDLHVTDMNGLDALVAEQTGGFPPAVVAAEKAMRTMFEFWLEQVFFELPGKSRERWTQQRECDAPWVGHWTRKTTYTDQGTVHENGRELRKLDLNTAITLTGPVPIPPGAPYEDPTGELKASKCTGVVLFDPAAGHPVRIERIGHLHTCCTMKFMGQLHTDDMKMDETTKVEVQDTDPLQAEAAKTIPQVDPKEALAREDKNLPRQVTNSLEMQLGLIPHGKFLMGSPRAEEYRNYDEDQHEVEMTRPFYMGAHEVTVGQFRKFVEDTGYKTVAEQSFMGGRGYNATSGALEFGRGYTWKDPGFTQTDMHPVTLIAWTDAQEFCAWLSRKEGKVYCLPTEAEWEYACRAGTTTTRVCGDAAEAMLKVANVGDASLKQKFPSLDTVKGDDGYTFTAPVGKFEANAWGLYDMHGNVSEWCADWVGPYDEKAKKDPRGAGIGAQKMARGGCFADAPRDIRSARRTGFALTNCYCGLGFRVVQIVPPVKP